MVTIRLTKGRSARLLKTFPSLAAGACGCADHKQGGLDADQRKARRPSRRGGPERRPDRRDARGAGVGAGRARRIGADRRARGHHDHRGPGAVADELQRGAGARRAGRQGRAAAGRGAAAEGPHGDPAGRRDRQVRRHLAARLHRPRRQRERQPHPGLRPADPGRPHRRRAAALARQGLGDERGRQDLHAASARGPEVVRRRADDRRRLRLLVRGHLQQQGHRADADPGHDARGQARAHRQGRRLHGQFRVRRAVLPVRGADDGRHAHRRRPGGAAVRASAATAPMRPAHYLKQFLPKYAGRRGRGQRRGQGGGLRQLGRAPALQQGLDAQPRAAGARARSAPCSRSTTRPG